MYYERIAVPVWLSSLVVVVMFVLLLLTSGSTAFIAILLALSFFILKYLLEERTVSKHIVFALVCVMLTFFFLVQFLDFGENALRGDYWERTSLWESAIEANYNPVFGVGTGDDTMVLNDYYTKHGLQTFADGNYNSHNQFIQVYLSNGIIGLVCLLLLLVRPLYLAMTKDQVLGILVMFPFIIYGMNEVFLGRYQGVVFFALLHQVFVSEYVDTRRINVFQTPVIPQ
jgi:O-antigen ligase